MRKITILLSTLVLTAILIVACAPEEPQTAAPDTESPAFTEVPTGILEFTPNVTLESPAETATLSPTEETTPGVPVTGEENPARLSRQLEFNVWNQDGEQIGTVNDMVIDLQSTSITYVIVDTAGSAEGGDRSVFVPWNSLQLQTGTGNTTGGEASAFVFQGDVETFNNAPDTDIETTVPDLGQPADDWDADIRNYWEDSAAPGVTEASTPSADDNVDTLQGVVLATELLGSNVSIGALGAMAGQLNPNATALPAGTATADTTQDNQGQEGSLNVGIEDVIVNTGTGNIDYVVIKAPFGDLEHWIPVPLDVLSWEANAQTFVLDRDIVTLQDAPFLESGQFPDNTQDEWDGLYSDFWDNLEETEQSQ